MIANDVDGDNTSDERNEAIDTHLRSLFEGGPAEGWMIFPHYPGFVRSWEATEKGKTLTGQRGFQVKDLDAAIAWVQQHKDTDLFVTPALFSEPNRRGANCYARRWVALEFDGAKHGVPDMSSIIDVDPTISIQSSVGENGIRNQHVFWDLGEWYTTDDELRSVDGVTHAMAALHDAVSERKDSSTVLRIPGTIHGKSRENPQVVTLLEDAGETHNLDELVYRFPPSSGKNPSVSGVAVTSEDVEKFLADHSEGDRLDIVDAVINKVMRGNPDSRHPSMMKAFGTLLRGAHAGYFPAAAVVEKGLVAWRTLIGDDSRDTNFHNNVRDVIGYILAEPEKSKDTFVHSLRAHRLGGLVDENKTREEIVAAISEDRVFVDDFAGAVPALVDRLKDTPLFQRGGELVEVGADASVTVVGRARLSCVFVQSGTEFVRVTKNGIAPAAPTPGILDAVLEWGDFPVPELERVATTPFLHGTELVTQEGYHAASKTYMVPECAWRAVSDDPSEDEVTRARETLEDMVRLFPFHGEHSKGNFFAYLFTAPLLGRINGPVKGVMFTASTQRSGKSKLANTAHRVWGGDSGDPFTAQRDHYARDAVRAYTAPGPVYVFDNFDDGHQLKNPTLSSTLTATGFMSLSKVGTDTGVRVSVDKVLAFTGNNIGAVRDFKDKVCWVRLVPRVDPRNRGNLFDYDGFVRDERVNIVWAILTLIRAYDVSGVKDSKGRMDGFEGWRDHVGSILRFHGLADEIDPLDDANESADWSEDDAVFLEAIAEFFGESTFLTRDIVSNVGENQIGGSISPNLLPRNIGEVWDGAFSERKRQSAIAGFLDKRVGSLVNGKLLTRDTDKDRRKVYGFAPVDDV